MTGASGTVIVPAHNEGRVVGRLLQGLAGSGCEPIQVIVAANGCSDDTVTKARDFADRLDLVVLDLLVASKTAALNAADCSTTNFPRAYVDADVMVSNWTLQAVFSALTTEACVLAARPPIDYNTTAATRLVRAFYRARSRTPSLMSALWGAGFYAVSEAGRKRWEKFPEDVADDLFVDGLFGPSETRVVLTEPVVVTPPRTTNALVHTLRRVYRVAPRSEVLHPQRSSALTMLDVIRANCRHPLHLCDAAVYLAVVGLARARSSRPSSQHGWERDETTR